MSWGLHSKKITEFLDLKKPFSYWKEPMPTRDLLCYSREGFFVSLGGKSVPATAGVIFSWLGDVILL
jgi:hypothetical protein